MAMVGEGEFSFSELVDRLINNIDYKNVPGLVKKISHKKYKSERERLRDEKVWSERIRRWK